MSLSKMGPRDKSLNFERFESKHRVKKLKKKLTFGI